MREYRKKWPARGRVEALRDKYGLTIDDYERMWDEQGGVCAICAQPETRISASGLTMPLCVDHNHTTNKVRALLCHACNTMIRCEDAERLRKGAIYLEEFNGKTD